MCTDNKACVIHAMGWISHNLGADLVGVEHTRLGKIPKVVGAEHAGKAKLFDIEVVLVEVTDDRWSLRATVNTAALTFSESRTATVAAQRFAELRDDLAEVELFVAQHAHPTKGWWSTAEVRETIEHATRAHSDFLAHLKNAFDEANQQAVINSAVGDA